MNNLPDIAVKELVLVGGGHSHVGLMKMFAMNPLPGLRLTLLAGDIHTPYSGMLPGFIAGHYSYDDVHLDLRPLAEFARCRLYHTRVTHIDAKNRLVYCDNRPPVKYDLLSINIGSTPDEYNIPGVREFAIPVKPVNHFIARLEKVIHQALNEEHFNRIAIIGGGASGVEMMLAIQHRMQREMDRLDCKDKPIHFTLISAADTLLPSHNESVQKRMTRLFAQRQIQLELGCSINRITLADNSVRKMIDCHNGRQIQADGIVWCTSASAARWPEESGLAVDDKGFIQVNDYLQSVSHSNIFAAGDVATMVNYLRPKSGVFAVRQGPPLFRNIKRFILGQPLQAYKPQKHFLSLLNCANHTAIASRGSLAFQGYWVWHYKNWIDVRFMKSFSQFPEMDQSIDTRIDPAMVGEDALQRLQEIPMRCGGCGAKVGSSVLRQVLDRLSSMTPEQPVAEGVILGMEQSDDAAVIKVPEGQFLVQSVDYFKSFINDPFLLGKIATNHALGDLYAMGATPHSALALVTLPYAVHDILEEELFQIMSGALETINANGMTLVGGHSGEGSDMAFGLNVNGFVNQQEMMTKSGLSVSDVLILTKPLGTGTLLAANMRLKAKGRWLDEAIEHMLQSNRQAAEIFKSFGVRACTDITGFGLLGHLLEMLKASRVCAQIKLSALPVMTGAAEMIAAGIFSSLQEENIRLKQVISNLDSFTNHENYPLLFDPQTAGGLLAAVPEENAAQCLEQLRHAGYQDATAIGIISSLAADEQLVELTG